MFISEEVDSLSKPYLSDPFHNKRDKRIDNWLKIIDKLPAPSKTEINLSKKVQVDFEYKDSVKLKALLLELLPWRKGPFQINDILVDSEWRSDEKWSRFKELKVDLKGKTILDVGSGNGYYAFRMLGDKARKVLCLEPNLMHVSQFAAMNKLIRSESIRMIPERLEETDISNTRFDVIFSMGLLYHQRDPSQHLNDLRRFLNVGGQLIIETIIAPEEFDMLIKPIEGRYASMPNVHLVHSDRGCKVLFEENSLVVKNESIAVKTTHFEQRNTEWMPFKSFESALDLQNENLTIEGYPAPIRKFYVLERVI